MKALFKKTILFKTEFSSLNILRFLFISTLLKQFITWLYVEIFGSSLWLSGNERILKKSLLSAAMDGGYVEHYANILLFWSFLLSTYIAFKFYKKSYIIPLIYLFLLLIESLSFQEIFTINLMPNLLNSLGLTFNPAYNNVLEIALWSVATIFFLLILSLNFKNIKYKEKNYISINFFFFLILAFFGIGLDQLISLPIISRTFWHGSVFSSFSSFIIYFLNLVEEWGEILSIGLAFLWLFNKTCILKNK